MATINPEDIIYKTESFIVNAHRNPFVCRTEGGHIRLFPKDAKRISNRSELTPKEAIEYMRLSIVAGQALKKAMNEQGIPVVWINYEDLGNWAFKKNERPVMHMHIFGRAKNAVKQKWPEAVYLPARESGFYDKFLPLSNKDKQLIQKYIGEYFNDTKFKDQNWGL
jgi:diadenosine tetraphosphate (Ap4A) HIT family hydrolase